MATEYMICVSYEDTIYECLLNRYGKKLLNKIDKNELFNINFEQIISYCVDIPDLYLTDNPKLISIIKELEQDNNVWFEDIIFVEIKDEFKKYITFDMGCIECTINRLNTTLLFKCTYDEFEDIFKYRDEYVYHDFIRATLDINKYYQDLITSGLSVNEMKNKFIINIYDIIFCEKMEYPDSDLDEDESE